MDVNSVMNVYNMNSTWNAMNSTNSSSSAATLISNIDSTVQEDYTSKNYFGQTTSSELQDIYEQVEPNYGIPLSYDKNGNFTMPSNTALPTDGLSTSDSNIISLLNSDNSASANLEENVLSQYTSLESGTLNENLSSILSSNPYNVYNSVNSLGDIQGQNSSNIINASA